MHLLACISTHILNSKASLLIYSTWYYFIQNYVLPPVHLGGSAEVHGYP